jgi:predicted amidohydrolase
MTGKTLPISGEIARHDASTLLDLTLVEGMSGYDALDMDGQRVQIKGRVIFDGQKSKPRVGQLKVGQEWDVVVLVLMNEDYEAVDIYCMSHGEVRAAMEDAASSKRISRGAMSVARFKAASEQVWSNESEQLQEKVPLKLVVSG